MSTKMVEFGAKSANLKQTGKNFLKNSVCEEHHIQEMEKLLLCVKCVLVEMQKMEYISLNMVFLMNSLV